MPRDNPRNCLLVQFLASESQRTDHVVPYAYMSPSLTKALCVRKSGATIRSWSSLKSCFQRRDALLDNSAFRHIQFKDICASIKTNMPENALVQTLFIWTKPAWPNGMSRIVLPHMHVDWLLPPICVFPSASCLCSFCKERPELATPPAWYKYQNSQNAKKCLRRAQSVLSGLRSESPKTASCVKSPVSDCFPLVRNGALARCKHLL